MRKIQVIGNITRDAEARTLDGGRSVINMDIACNEKWRDKNGDKQERVHYIKCAIWRDNTSIVQYLTKGTKVYVEGAPEVDCYVNKEGKAVGSVKINVREIEFLGGGKNQESSNQSGHQDGRGASSGSESLTPTPDDDLPF